MAEALSLLIDKTPENGLNLIKGHTNNIHFDYLIFL